MKKRSRALNRLKVKEVNSLGVGTHEDGGGLRLKVDANGNRSWLLRYPFQGKRHEVGLGRAADVSLAEARDQREAFRRAIREGRDPRVKVSPTSASADATSETLKEVSLREAFEEFYEHHRKRLSHPKHIAQWRTTVETYAAAILDKPICAITATDVADALRPIWNDKHETAKRTFQRLDAVFKDAMARDYIEINPCPKARIQLGRVRQVVQHQASLPWQNVSAFIQGFKDGLGHGEAMTRLALEFTILTAVRDNEARGAAWTEFDLEQALWTIPAERMGKTKLPHRVPLSSRCLAILATAKRLASKSTLVFTGSCKETGGLSENTLAQLASKVARELGFGHITAHGFRSTFKVWATESARARDEVSEAALAHLDKDKVRRAYRRTDYLGERRELMEAWATFCASNCCEKS